MSFIETCHSWQPYFATTAEKSSEEKRGLCFSETKGNNSSTNLRSQALKN